MTKEKSNTIWWQDGFYDYQIEGGYEITHEQWQGLLNGQSEGKVIMTAGNGMPYLADYVPTLDEVRQAKLAEVAGYYSSEAVNAFTLNGKSLWFDKSKRTSLASAIEAAETAGETTTKIWHPGPPPVAVVVSIETFKQMLTDLEYYAKCCYDVEQGHIAAIYALDAKEAIQAYDHTTGCRAQLEYNI